MGHRYLTMVADQATGHLQAIRTAKKGAARPRLVKAMHQIQRATGRHIPRVHADGAGELSKGAPLRYARREGITVTRTARLASKNEKKAERAVRTIKDCARKQLATAKLPRSLWEYAARDWVAKLNNIP